MRIVVGGHLSNNCTVLDLTAYEGHCASLPGIPATFAFSMSLVNSGLMLVARGTVITCDKNYDDGNNGNGKDKGVELMKQNDTESVVMIKWKKSCLQPDD